MPLLDSCAFLPPRDAVEDFPELFEAVGREMHCQVDRVHDPAHNCFTFVSRAVTLLQFLEGDWLSPLGSVLVVERTEDLIDGLHQRVVDSAKERSLGQGDAVVHKNIVVLKWMPVVGKDGSRSTGRLTAMGMDGRGVGSRVHTGAICLARSSR